MSDAPNPSGSAERDAGQTVVVVVISGAQHLAAIARAVAEPLASAGAVEQVYAAIGPVANSVVECVTAPERTERS